MKLPPKNTSKTVYPIRPEYKAMFSEGFKDAKAAIADGAARNTAAKLRGKSSPKTSFQLKLV